MHLDTGLARRLKDVSTLSESDTKEALRKGFVAISQKTNTIGITKKGDKLIRKLA